MHARTHTHTKCKHVHTFWLLTFIIGLLDNDPPPKFAHNNFGCQATTNEHTYLCMHTAHLYTHRHAHTLIHCSYMTLIGVHEMHHLPTICDQIRENPPYAIFPENRVRCKPNHRANSRSSFRPIACFAVELVFFQSSPHPQHSRNYGLKVLLCTHMAFLYTTCIPEVN